MVVNDFNRIAPFYDRIAKLIFGNQLIRAQIHFLSEIKPNDDVLILGGGTGQLLEYFPSCNKVLFVEKSEQMILYASRRKIEADVDYINEDFLNYDHNRKFDIIICPFFLDCFDEINLHQVLRKIKSSLKSEGNLLVIDFKKNGFNGLMLKSMHVFFRIFSKLESKSLLDIHQKVLDVGFREAKVKFSHRNQLFSRLYRNL